MFTLDTAKPSILPTNVAHFDIDSVKRRTMLTWNAKDLGCEDVA